MCSEYCVVCSVQCEVFNIFDVKRSKSALKLIGRTDVTGYERLLLALGTRHYI